MKVQILISDVEKMKERLDNRIQKAFEQATQFVADSIRAEMGLPAQSYGILEAEIIEPRQN